MTARIRSYIAIALVCGGARAAAAQAAVPRWTLTRDIAIGASGAGQVTNPTAVTVGLRGEIVVFDYVSRTINRYTERGTFTAALTIPAQCRSLGGLGFLGDTLWASDANQNNLMLFRSGRTEPDLYPLAYDPRIPGFAAAVPRVVMRGGLTVAQSGGAQPGSSGAGKSAHLASSIVALRRDGAVVATLATPMNEIGPAISVSVLAGTSPTGSPMIRGMISAQPFQEHALWAGPSDGSGVVVVDAPIHVAGAAAFVVRTFDSTGRLVRSRSYPYEPVPVTPEMIRNATDDVAQRMGPDAEQSYRSQLITPAFMPPVRQLLVGRDGSVWLRRNAGADGAQPWMVLDAGGTVVAEVMLKPEAGTKLLYADLDQVFIAQRGEILARYRVKR